MVNYEYKNKRTDQMSGPLITLKIKASVIIQMQSYTQYKCSVAAFYDLYGTYSDSVWANKKEIGNSKCTIWFDIFE